MFRSFINLLLVSTFASSPALASSFPLSQQKYNVTIRDQNVRSVFEELSEALGVPILLSEAVDGRVSASFEDADAEALLNGISESKGLDWRFDGRRIRVTSQSEQITRIVDLDGVKLKDLESALTALDVYNDRFRMTAVDGEFAMIVAPPEYTAVVEVILSALIETESEERKARELAEQERLRFERLEREAALKREQWERQRRLEFEYQQLLRSQRGPQVIRNGVWGG